MCFRNATCSASVQILVLERRLDICLERLCMYSRESESSGEIGRVSRKSLSEVFAVECRLSLDGILGSALEWEKNGG